MVGQLGDASPQVRPLLASKLVQPRLHASLVARSRLWTALNQSQDAELTLVTAPPGSGKTTLVSSWLANQAAEPVAWVTLDRYDDDPVRLWTYVCAAVEATKTQSVESALALLQATDPPVQSAVDELHNSLSSFPGRLIIVLDNLHHVRRRDSLELLVYAIERLPDPIRIVAMSDESGGGELARLKAGGKVAEISSEELAFTASEAQELLLTNGGPVLSEADLALLAGRTEGWAAAIRLAAGPLSASRSPGLRIRSYSGAEPPLADYLTLEFLDSTDEETRRLLVQTSAFEVFTASLCDAVLETQDAKVKLRELHRTNLFLHELDRPGNWFRYHPMLRNLLRDELDRTEPGRSTALCVRAANWLLEHDHVEEALAQISTSSDPELIADLLTSAHVTMIRSGRLTVFMEWLDSLPARAVDTRPILAAAGALAAALVGRPMVRREQLLRTAEGAAAESSPDESRYVSAIVAMTRSLTPPSDLSAAIEDARRAVDFSRQHFSELTVAALAALARNLFLAGDYSAARGVSEEALERPESLERPHGLINAHAIHSMTESWLGQTGAGESEARLAIALAAKSGLSETWSAGIAHHALGFSLLIQRLDAEAEPELLRAEALARAAEPRLDHAHALLLLAGARVGVGELALAATELENALEQLSSFTDPGYLPTLAHAIQSRLDEAGQGIERDTGLPSPAEWAVLRLLATDLSRRAIADQLFLSHNTVKTHTLSIYRKLGVHSRGAAVTQARADGLLPKPGPDATEGALPG